MSIQVEHDIIPLSRFRASYKEFVESLKKENRTLVLTQNGKAAAIVVSPQEYDQLKGQQEVRSLIAARLKEISEQRFIEDENAMWDELES